SRKSAIDPLLLHFHLHSSTMLIWLFLPLISSAEYLEKGSKVQKFFNLTTPYEHHHILRVNASAPVEIRLSSCQFNGGSLLASSKDAEIVLFPSLLLKLMTDSSAGCPVDPFYGEPSANASVYVSVTSQEQAVNYSISWPKYEHTFKFEANSSRHFSLKVNVDVQKGLYIHSSLSINSSIELSVAGCIQQQGFSLFNLSSPLSNALNLSSASLIDLVEKILCPSDSLLYHGENIDLYFIIKSLTPLSSGLLQIAPSVHNDTKSLDGPRIKRNIDSCFSLEERAIQYSHIDPIHSESEEEIQLDVHVESGRLRVSILGCDDSPPFSLGEFLPGMHTVIMNSLLESLHCNYTVRSGFPLSLEGILKSQGQIKLRTKSDEDSSSILFKLEYVIILVLILLLIFACTYTICYRLGMRKRARGKISSEKKPSISVIETSWH
ncbi:hypothetical protein PMAYCL1PPCAC_17514, partial [Pristionchus mayeri]